MILLSAALIVRDEAATLRRCLASLDGLVDEIVVVDTGSSDDSPRIAADLGARVVHHEWQGDFSAARNVGLSHARGSWILYVDADECAQRLERDVLAATLADPRTVAATVKLRSRTGFTRYHEPRLFRNDPRIRFRHLIHETMMPDVHAVIRTDGARIGRSPLAIDHFGYDGDQGRKHRRDVPLLRARLSSDPGHVYSWNHLGRALAGLDDTAGAVDAWRRGIAVVRAAGVEDARDALPYGSLLLCREAADSHAAVLDEAVERFPRDYLFAWLRARRLVDDRQWSEALAVLEALAAIDSETFCSEEGVAYDARIFGAATHEAIGFCHFQLGRYRESARWYDAAERSEPDNPAHAIRGRLAAARASRTIARS